MIGAFADATGSTPRTFRTGLKEFDSWLFGI